MDRHHAHSPLVNSLCTATGHLQVWRQPLTASTATPVAQPGGGCRTVCPRQKVLLWCPGSPSCGAVGFLQASDCGALLT